jgi:hypothetical protein
MDQRLLHRQEDAARLEELAVEVEIRSMLLLHLTRSINKNYIFLVFEGEFYLSLMLW